MSGVICRLLLGDNGSLGDGVGRGSNCCAIGSGRLVLVLRSTGRRVVSTILTRRPGGIVALSALFKNGSRLGAGTILRVHSTNVSFGAMWVDGAVGRRCGVPRLPLSVSLRTGPVLGRLGLTGGGLTRLGNVTRAVPGRSVLVGALALRRTGSDSRIRGVMAARSSLCHTSLSLEEIFAGTSAGRMLGCQRTVGGNFSLIHEAEVLSGGIVERVRRRLRNGGTKFHSIPNAALGGGEGRMVCAPPRSGIMIRECVRGLRACVGGSSLGSISPLVGVTIVRRRFRDVRPFCSNGNEANEVVSVLCLITGGLLSLPVLCLDECVARGGARCCGLLRRVEVMGNSGSGR